MPDRFTITVQLLNSVKLGRWLCLDAMLDASLMINDIPFCERVLPLCAFDGEQLIDPGLPAYDAVNTGKAVYLGSAAIFYVDMVQTRSFVQSVANDFPGTELPLYGDATSRAPKPLTRLVTRRGPAASTLTKHVTIPPCIVQWYGYGDLDKTVSMINSLPGIGGKTSNGYGRFEITKTSVDNHADPLSVIIDPQTGELLRPVPQSMQSIIPSRDYRHRIESTRPPYFWASHAIPSCVPSSGFIDGML